MATDRAGYNKRGEELLAADRGDWSSTIFWCDIHALAGSFTKTFEGLAQADVRGIINLALSLRPHGSWAVFRQAVKEEILSRELVVKQHGIGEQAWAYKHRPVQGHEAALHGSWHLHLQEL